MPLFFFCSGYFFSPKDLNKPYNIILIKKIKRLLIPFFSWYFIPKFFSNANMLEELVRLLKTPDTGLWFLWALFWVYFLNLFSVYISLKFKHKAQSYIYLLTILSIVASLKFLNLKLLGLSQIYYHALFFSSAYLLKTFSVIEYIRKRPIKYILIILAVYVEYLYITNPQMFFKFLCGEILALTLFTLCAFNSRVLSYLGKNTLGIYALHPWFSSLTFSLKLFPEHFQFLTIVLNTFMRISASLIFTLIIKNSSLFLTAILPIVAKSAP